MNENKMGVMPVGKLLITMSVPMMISMLVQALYNVVDSFFVAKISQDALNAVSLAFPVQNVLIGVGVGTGVGVNALLSRNLGEKDFEGANRAAGCGILLAVLSGLAAVLVGQVLPRAFFEIQTDIPGIIEQGTEYLTICTTCSMGVMLGIMFERLLQSTGKTVFTMIAQTVGAVINIVMDPIFIFGNGLVWEGENPLARFCTEHGFGLGVVGAAVATVAGQIAGAVLGLIFNLAANKEISFRLKYLRPKAQAVRQIYAVGVPSMVMNCIGSVMVFGLNQILISFTDAATAVFGIYFKLQSFIFMPVFGLNNGLVPIIAYNYGARKRKRIIDTRRLAWITATVIMLLGLTVAELFPDRLLGIFEASDEMLAIGVPALRIICTSFIFAGFGVVSGSVYQALGHGVLGMLVSIVRQLLVLLPAAFLLSLSGRLELVWLAFPIAELFSVTMCLYFNRKITREVIDPLDQPQEQ